LSAPLGSAFQAASHPFDSPFQPLAPALPVCGRCGVKSNVPKKFSIELKEAGALASREKGELRDVE
jgi:hypothetical protein